MLNNPASGSIYSAYTRPYGINCRGISWRSTSQGGAYAFRTGRNPGHSLGRVGPPPGQQAVTPGYVSFRYLLELDKPWTRPPGVYRGTCLYGAGRDLDFGPNFSGSVDGVSLDFMLIVLSDMYGHFPGDHGGVVSADLVPSGGWFNRHRRAAPWPDAGAVSRTGRGPGQRAAAVGRLARGGRRSPARPAHGVTACDARDGIVEPRLAIHRIAAPGSVPSGSWLAADVGRAAARRRERDPVEAVVPAQCRALPTGARGRHRRIASKNATTSRLSLRSRKQHT
ncbi:hypothetical protein [Burkholderia plantarii]|uniref:hypothetical protein n=1 Tax=Burkholderia plantarii TaxID=41899 RepID=UPI0018DBD660|nr:hypothetical protein [Burkholderia plantarii]MBI0331230.1 hypothetical protein [Burkholderia plantarii]